MADNDVPLLLWIFATSRSLHILILNLLINMVQFRALAKKNTRKQKFLERQLLKSKTRTPSQFLSNPVDVMIDPKALKEKSQKILSVEHSDKCLKLPTKKTMKKSWSKNLQRWVTALHDKKSRIGIALPKNTTLLQACLRVSWSANSLVRSQHFLPQIESLQIHLNPV